MGEPAPQLDPAEIGQKEVTTTGTSEISMRNHVPAWLEYMTLPCRRAMSDITRHT